jgi:hypothetical protein
MRSLFSFSLLGKCGLSSLVAATWIHSAQAQTTPTLEFFAGAGNTTATGPTVAEQTITFQKNGNNPTDNTPAPYLPTTTATFVLSNQQFGANDTHQGVMFGGQSNSTGTTPAGLPIFPLLNSLGVSSNSHYTSGNTVGSGLDIEVNRSLQLCTDLQYVATTTATARVYYADLTITFNQAVVNPVLHVTGLGAPGNGVGTVGGSTEFTVLTSGVTLSQLSGSDELQVSDNSIGNASANPSSATGNGAASGSVQVTTPPAGVTSLVLQVYLRKAGNVSTSTAAYTDGWLLGVSALTPAPTPLPVTLTSFAAQALPNHAARLTWQTASELNNAYFAVERSFDGASFQEVGQVAGQGTKAIASTYTFTEGGSGQRAPGPIYYRLRQVDLAGSSTYSPMRTLTFTAASATVGLAPNPATGTADLDLTQLPAGVYQVTVLDVTGRPLLHQDLAAGLAHTLPLHHLPSGQYIVLVRGKTLQLSKRLSRL